MVRYYAKGLPDLQQNLDKSIQISVYRLTRAELIYQNGCPALFYNIIYVFSVAHMDFIKIYVLHNLYFQCKDWQNY